MAIVLAVRRVAERQIVHRLRAADATAPGRACPLPGLRWLQARRLRRMLAAGAVREASPGLYYLDEAGLAGFRRWRRRRVLAALSGGLLAALGALHIGRK